MSKVEVKTTSTDEEEKAFLEANKMMILLKDQRNRFLPDDNAKRLDGFRRPVRFWMHEDQSIRKAFLMLPEGIKRHQDIYEHPLCFYRIMVDETHKLRVLDEVMFIAQDFSWVHEARVTHASDRVTLKPHGTETELDWSQPQQTAAKAAA
jgi:hypothetical protein